MAVDRKLRLREAWRVCVCVAVVFGAAIAPAGAQAAGSVSPERLRADALTEPIGLDDAAPDLSWALRAHGRNVSQTAYEIRAASDERRLRRGRPDLWDTGKVRTARNSGIRYAGRRMGSRARRMAGPRLGPARPSLALEPARDVRNRAARAE